jgi:ornithine decarboxylase
VSELLTLGYAEGDPLAAIRDCDHATPFFLLDPTRVRAAYERFAEVFPGALIRYAMKANAEPAVLRELQAAGCGFEIASVGELDVLLALGIDPATIIYGTSVKPRLHIQRAHGAGIRTFAFDSDEELARIADAAPGSQVYVRAVASDPSSAYTMSAKFGAADGVLVELLHAAVDHGLRPCGISFNLGSQVRSATAWAQAIERIAPACAAAQRAGLPLELIDIGGGFPSRYGDAGVPGLDDIARGVRSAMRHGLPPTLVMEPGRAMVADAMVLVASVVGRSERAGRPWLYLDAGVYNGLFEALACQGSIAHRVTALDQRPDRTDVECFVLAGPTGDGLDVIAGEVWLPASLGEGDRLVFHEVGAYSVPFLTRFNGFPVPPVHLMTWEVAA